MFINARLPIRKLFTDLCTIETSVETTDIYGGTSYEDVILCENEPCRISYSTFKNADDSNNGASNISQIIKLFIREDLNIPTGSRLTVTRGSVTGEYKASGVPAIHSNHQEINLELVKKYA